MAENWQVRGTYFEACNCAIACPCNFLSAPTEGECKVIVAWHVDEGQYGAVEPDWHERRSVRLLTRTHDAGEVEGGPVHG